MEMSLCNIQIKHLQHQKNIRGSCCEHVACNIQTPGALNITRCVQHRNSTSTISKINVCNLKKIVDNELSKIRGKPLRNIYFMLVETFKYLVENATFKYNTCNTRVKHSQHRDSLCNIHTTKRLKHSHETSGTIES
jgi:hypothetical protein